MGIPRTAVREVREGKVKGEACVGHYFSTFDSFSIESATG